MRKPVINSRVVLDFATGLLWLVFLLSSAIWARSYFKDLEVFGIYNCDHERIGRFVAEAYRGRAGISIGIPSAAPSLGGSGSFSLETDAHEGRAYFALWDSNSPALRWIQFNYFHGTDGFLGYPLNFWEIKLSIWIWPITVISAMLLAFRIGLGIRRTGRIKSATTPGTRRPSLRITERLVRGASAISLLSCIASIALLIESYRSPADWTRTTWNAAQEAFTSNSLIINRGWLDVDRYAGHGVSPTRAKSEYKLDEIDADTGWKCTHPTAESIFASGWMNFGFGRSLDGFIGGDSGGGGFGVRLWVAAVFFAILPTIYLAKKFLPNPKSLKGFCPTCGYDLRATPKMCPECGTTFNQLEKN